MRDLPTVTWIHALRSADSTAACRARSWDLIDVPAQLELGSNVCEQRTLRGVDAHAEPEEGVDALAEVLERLAIDNVLERDRMIAHHIQARGSDVAHVSPLVPPTWASESSRPLPS